MARGCDAAVTTAFLAALDRLPRGHSRGEYAGRRWGVTIDEAADRKRLWLWAEEQGGRGRVSFNLYRLAAGVALRPCEMPADTVVAFVLGYCPDLPSAPPFADAARIG